MMEAWSKFLDATGLAIIISVASFLASLAAYRVSVVQHSDSEAADLISEHYKEMISLHELRAEYPYQSHLFEIDSQYEIIKLSLLEVAREQSKENLIKLMLEERAIARRIFSMYESSFYLWCNANKHRDKFRLSFLKDVLDYFTNRLLTNPRLVWYWSHSGGCLCNHYEKETRLYYDSHVKILSIDDLGPFFYKPESITQQNGSET